jgi:hypothetical protein
VAFIDAAGTEVDEVRLMGQLRFIEQFCRCVGFSYPTAGIDPVNL